MSTIIVKNGFIIGSVIDLITWWWVVALYSRIAV
jgi:hypothetical protein